MVTKRDTKIIHYKITARSQIARPITRSIARPINSITFPFHGYTYNNSSITNLFRRGFVIELKGGYK